MAETYDRLAQKVADRLRSVDSKTRIVIGIAGVPGSGKTTLGTAVSNRINALFDANEPIAVALPMDGFHYTRAQLSAMPDPANAHHRRGAAFTFDGEGFFKLIQALRSPIGDVDDVAAGSIYAPSFDHAVKDPVADSIPIYPSHRVVLVEGNYCALNRAPWSDTAKLMTELWYIDTPPEVAHERLAKRHLASGIVPDEKTAWERAKGTDELNAQDVRTNRLEVDEIIEG